MVSNHRHHLRRLKVLYWCIVGSGVTGVTVGIGVISDHYSLLLIVISTYTPDVSTVVALIVVVPTETPVTTPSAFTVAILGFFDTHSMPLFVAFSGVTDRFIIFFHLS